MTVTDRRTEAPPGWLVLLLAVACGLTVANLYYTQPLLSLLGDTFKITPVAAGGLITATQLGYAAGMILLVPLGDRAETRRLVSTLLVVTTVGLTVAGIAPTYPLLLAGALISGATSVVVQILVPYAAGLSPDHLRGRIVGQVVSGLLFGVLLSRTVGSLLAEATNWRVVFLVAAGMMAVLSVALRFALPRREPTTRVPYAELLLSTVRLVRQHQPLRRRALYQAAMFGAFSAFWTTVSYVLTAPPFGFSQLGVGIFALVGAGGALVAPIAGRLADRGLSRPLTAAAFVTAAVAFGIAGFGAHNVIFLAVAAILIDMAVQGSLIFGQHTIYALDPAARSRLNSVYLATFFLGGAIGSQLGAYAYHLGGWTGVAVFGALLPILALTYWTTERP
ncbi:MFS transporter [Fodinicola acaciae]|uniref:MFS transporter n=1 Tax=Fodinicola acaciae TaxID=2681555 RepID=UPI001651F06E|nr:MFS transporter [Fodinicola acaciae]